MVMILPDNRYRGWLMAQPELCLAFMQLKPAEMLLDLSPQKPNRPFAT
jgi:hypothetical protein